MLLPFASRAEQPERQFVYIDPEVHTKQYPAADTSMTDPHYATRLDPIEECHPQFM